MSSSIAAVFTYFLTGLPAVVQAVDPNGIVVDGYAGNIPPPPAPILFVGNTNPLTAIANEGTRAYFELGAGNAEEDYYVPCYIDAAVAGMDQSACRNTALAVWDGVLHFIAQDLTLGGLLKKGRWAEVTDWQMVQTDGPEEGKEGRRTVIAFRIHCRNLYAP